MLNRQSLGLNDDRAVCISLWFIQVIYFLFNVGETMLDVTIRPHIVNLVCEQLYSKNVCMHLVDYPEHTQVVHADSGMYFTIYRMLVNIPTFFVGLFCGAWSDVYGRKLPMAIPSFGSILAVIVYAGSTQVKHWAIVVVLVGTFVQGLFGRSAVISMAVNSYTSEKSTVDDRTVRLGRLLAMQYFGRCIGALLAGVMGFNIIAAFGVIGGIQLVGLLSVIVGVKDTTKEKGDAVTETSSNQCIRNYFSDGLEASFFIISKQRPNNGRCLVILIILICVLHGINVTPHPDLLLFVVTGEPLNWSNSQYSYLLSFENISMGIALFLTLPLLSDLLKLSDFDIMLFGMICQIVFCISIQFATKYWAMYMLIFLWSLSIIVRNCVRSILSKAVENNDLGKIFSLLSCLETTAKILGPLIFLNLYGATLHINKWLVFYVTTGVCIISTGLITFAKFRHEKFIDGKEIASLIIASDDSSDDNKACEIPEVNSIEGKNTSSHIPGYKTFE